MKRFFSHLHLSDEPVLRRKLLLFLLPLTVLGLVMCICITPLPVDDDVYLLIDTTGSYTVTNDTELSYASDALYTSSNSAVDVQLILPAGEEVALSTDGDTTRLAAGGGAASETVISRNETVANLLRRNQIEVGEDEMVVVDLSDGTPHITVCRQYTRLRQQQVKTDFPVERVANPLLAKGTENILTPGVSGSVTETYLDVYTQGILTSSEFLSTTEDTSVAQVVEYGTLVDEVSANDELVDVHQNEDGSGYLTFASGDTMAFTSRVTSNATAYAIHGGTASGLPTAYGNIAVDPSVFPYGTRFYIYTQDGYLTYGMATAADCGSGITGYEMDLWFDSFDEACAFGRRDCTVFVLD